jgi:hypothetical protein
MEDVVSHHGDVMVEVVEISDDDSCDDVPLHHGDQNMELAMISVSDLN